MSGISTISAKKGTFMHICLLLFAGIQLEGFYDTSCFPAVCSCFLSGDSHLGIFLDAPNNNNTGGCVDDSRRNKANKAL